MLKLSSTTCYFFILSFSLSLSLLFVWLSWYENSCFYLLKMVNLKILNSDPRRISLVNLSFPGLSSIKNYFRKYKMVAFSLYLSYFCNLNKIGRNSLDFSFCDLINSSICQKFARGKNLISYKLEMYLFSKIKRILKNLFDWNSLKLEAKSVLIPEVVLTRIIDTCKVSSLLFSNCLLFSN